MSSQTDVPEDEALARFGVRPVAPLGGRLNRHWLVESGRERLVLRRWAAGTYPASVDYEARLLARLAARGWPVAPVVAGPVEMGGHVWTLAPFLPGEPPAPEDPWGEPRTRGRLLAEFHAGIADLQDLGQRPGWRRCEDILADPTLDEILARSETDRPEEVRIVRWHWERARARIAGLELASRPGLIVHGDWTPWNLRFQDGRLSGLLDFELSHWDHRVADFALSWRGKYDEVVRGYDEVSPLSAAEWALLTPVWWAELIEGACRDMQAGVRDDGWTVKKLLQRSSLMGPDAVPYGR